MPHGRKTSGVKTKTAQMPKRVRSEHNLVVSPSVRRLLRDSQGKLRRAAATTRKAGLHATSRDIREALRAITRALATRTATTVWLVECERASGRGFKRFGHTDLRAERQQPIKKRPRPVGDGDRVRA